MNKIPSLRFSRLFLIIFAVHVNAALKRDCYDIADQIIEQFDPNTELLEGLQENNLKKIQFALDLGASPDEDFESSTENSNEIFTPLTWLTRKQFNSTKVLDRIKLLLRYGADINKKDNNGYLPLQSSMRADDDSVAYFLIAQGAGLNLVDDFNDTPLVAAIESGHYKLASKIIDLGADVNAYNPLSAAVMLGKTKLVEKLLENGADTDVEDNWGFTPLYWAILGDQDMVEKILLNGAKVNGAFGSDKNLTHLRTAIDVSDPQKVQLLLKYGADTEDAYDYALKHGNHEIAEIIRNHEQKNDESN